MSQSNSIGTVVPVFTGHDDVDLISIQDEGVLVGTRPILNFIGTGVSAVDNPGQNRVDVTIADQANVADFEVPGAADIIAFNASANEQAFATALTIPASELVNGAVAELIWHLELTTTGAQTVRWRVRSPNLAGTALMDTGLLSASAVTATSFAYVFKIFGPNAAGAAAPVFVNYIRAPGVGSGSSITQPNNLATNAALTFVLTAQTNAVGANSFECTGAHATLVRA